MSLTVGGFPKAEVSFDMDDVRAIADNVYGVDMRLVRASGLLRKNKNAIEEAMRIAGRDAIKSLISTSLT